MRKHVLKVSLKEFLKLLKYLASSSINTISVVRSPLQSSSSREKDKIGESFHKACMGTFSSNRSPPINRHLVCKFFMKTLIIMSISIKIYRPYVCDPLDLYISLVNNYKYPIIPYCSTFIYYLHQHID